MNCIHQGFLQESLKNIQELISKGQDGADPQLVCWGFIARGLARERLEQLDEAVSDLLEGIRLADTLPDYYWKILAQAFLGRCYLKQNKIAQVFDSLEVGENIHNHKGISGPPLFHLRIVLAEANLMVAEQSDGVFP